MSKRSSERRGCVVVGLDDGMQPAGTLTAAADEAQRRGIGLSVVTVLRHRIDADPSVAVHRHQQQWAEAAALQDLHAAAVSLRFSHPELSVTTYCLGESEVGPDRDPLAAAQLLVIGTHGQGSLQSLALESIGHLLLRSSRCAILVIRENSPAPALEPGDRPVILVGVSEEPSDALVVRAAYDESVGCGGEVLLLHAYALRPGEAPAQGRDRARALLADFVLRAPTGTSVSVMVIEDNPVTALLRLASKAKLLVIGGRTGSLSAPERESVSRMMLEAVPCPVLAVPRHLSAGPAAPLTGLVLAPADDRGPAPSRAF
jgi:nucleotide-binding universal stress UspA family protein